MKKCKCGKEMGLLLAWDTHAYNLWLCEACGLILKEDVWNNPGLRWLTLTGCLETELETETL